MLECFIWDEVLEGKEIKSVDKMVKWLYRLKEKVKKIMIRFLLIVLFNVRKIINIFW